MALTGLSPIQKLIIYNKIMILLSECPLLHGSLCFLLPCSLYRRKWFASSFQQPILRTMFALATFQ
jgi:hypothetical protein